MKIIQSTLCFVLSEEARCLMLFRTRPPHQERWNAPGGKLLADEEPHVGCIRELKEETGLTVSPTSRGFVDCLELHQPQTIYRLHLFVARHPQVIITPGTEGRFQWLSLKTVLTAPEVVHNIPLFLPSILSGHSIQGVFKYNGDFLERYEINLALTGKGMLI